MRPRSYEVDGGWLTGTARGAFIVPAGYCSGHPDTLHATADEAYQCYRKYLVERTLKLDGRRGAPGPCTACGTSTDRTVVINGQPRDWWCGEHATAEDVTAWWNSSQDKDGAP